MTTEASSPEPENKKRNKDDERRRVALVLLFLLLSFICIFCSSQGALYFIDRERIADHMRSALQADYGPGVPIVFSAVERDKILEAIREDELALLATPELIKNGIFIPDLPQSIAQITPTPTPIPPTPTLTPTSTPTPTPIPPTSSPPDTAQPSPPPPTSTPQPTSPPPTSPPPSPTIPTPSPTTIPPPSPTSPPSPAPTSTSPPPPPPPTFTPVPNNPPVAVDDAVFTDEDIAVVIVVLANDSDSDGTLVPSSVTVISGPANGTTSVNTTTGEITYTPNPNFFSGPNDTFTYQVCDDDGDCDTATVTVTVNPVNDPPTAVDDTGAINQDTVAIIDVAANDTDIDGNLDPASVITITTPLSGTTMLGPSAGEITYTPNPGISGVDTFNYQICDIAPPTPAPLCDTAVVTITITDTVPAPPTNLRAAPGDMQISLGWDHTPEPDLAGYRVYRSVGGGPPFLFLTTTPVITKYFDISLTNGITYAYTVTAIDVGSNESGPSNIASAIPGAIITNTTSVTCGGITFTNCIDAAGPPDGLDATISGTGTITFDFGIGQGIIDGPGFDMVYYERYRPGIPGVRLDFVRIEISTDGITWFTVFEWDGDNPGDIVGTNIDSYASDANGEQEDEDILESDLYPGSAGSHGIAIDIGVLTPSGNAYRFIRITDPGSSLGPNKHPDIDAVERLN